MAKEAVLFTENNARIIKDPAVIARIKNFPNVVLDPDRAPLAGIAPHYWKQSGKGIVAMNAVERALRDRHIEKNGAYNNLVMIGERKRNNWKPFIAAGIFAAGLLIYTLLRKYG